MHHDVNDADTWCVYGLANLTRTLLSLASFIIMMVGQFATRTAESIEAAMNLRLWVFTEGIVCFQIRTSDGVNLLTRLTLMHMPSTVNVSVIRGFPCRASRLKPMTLPELLTSFEVLALQPQHHRSVRPPLPEELQELQGRPPS